MTIPNLIIDLAEILLEWGCGKLSGDEGFGVLMMSHHQSSNTDTRPGKNWNEKQCRGIT